MSPCGRPDAGDDQSLVHLELCYCDVYFQEREWIEALHRKEKPFDHLNVFKNEYNEFDKYGVKEKYVYHLLAKTPQVSELSLGDTHLDETLFQFLGNHCQRLALNGCALFGGRLEFMKACQGFAVKHFSVKGRMTLLPELKSIQYLMPNITYLTLPVPRPELFPVAIPFAAHYARVGQIIASMRRLEVLHLETDDGYFEHEHIGCLLNQVAIELGSQLKILRIGLYPVNDEALISVGNHCRLLQDLRLGIETESATGAKKAFNEPFNEQVTNSCLSAVSRMQFLRSLSFNRTNIDCNGVRLLFDSLRKLIRAEFNYCPKLNNLVVESAISWARSKRKSGHTFICKNSNCFPTLLQQERLQVISNLFIDYEPFPEINDQDQDFFEDSSDSNDIFF